MGDNTETALVNVATDELEQLNGQPTTPDSRGRLPKAQRTKIIFGADNSGSDVTPDTPFPVDAAAVVAKLDELLAELNQKLEAGQSIGPVALDPTTLAALEQVTATIANLPGAAAAASYGSGTANQAGVAPADAPGRLMGYAIRETSGTAGATVRLRSGTTVSGTPLGSGVTLAPNESVREWFGPTGINVPTAVFLERVSGATEVTVYWAAP